MIRVTKRLAPIYSYCTLFLSAVCLPLLSPAAPCIQVLPSTMMFASQPYAVVAPQTLTITNNGDAVAAYTVTSSAFWLSANLISGTLAPGEGTNCVVQVATRGLAPRVYQGVLTISTLAETNGPQNVTVTLCVGAALPPSTIVAWGNNGHGQTSVPNGLWNATAVSLGSWHSLALRADGTVVAWGSSISGQTNVPAGLSNAVSVAAGGQHSLALRTDGTVVAWGWNFFGQANVPAGLTNVVAVTAGDSHSLALRADGKVVAWGWNINGQANVPAGLSNVVAVAAGGLHSLALRANGTVVAWGSNDSGQTSVPTGLTNAVAVAAGGSFSLAVRADGTVMGWGKNDVGQTSVPVGVTNAVAVSGGLQHAMALCSDGKVVAWGQNDYGQANVPAGLSNTVSVACGGYASFALVQPPPALLTIISPFGTPNPPCGVNKLVPNTLQNCWANNAVQGTTQYVCIGWAGTGSVPSIGTSNRVSFVITNDSAITWCWRTNYWLDVATSDGGTVTNTSGWYASGHMAVLNASNWPGRTFIAWKGNTNGCFVNGAQITVPMDESRSIQALFTGPGTHVLTFTGTTYSAITPQIITITNTGIDDFNYTISSDTPWLTVATPTGSLAPGESTTCVVRVSTCGKVPGTYRGALTISAPWATNGPQTVIATMQTITPPSVGIGWEYNGYGVVNVPISLTNAVALASGSYHSLAIRADGTVTAWGDPAYNALYTPVGLTNAVAVACGNYYSLVACADGSVVAFGKNDKGQASPPVGLINAVAVAAGYEHSMALCADGTVVVFGDNTYGQWNVPAGLTNVVAVAAGYGHSLALRADGTVVAWGRNISGETSVPAGLSNVVAVAAGSRHSLALRADGTVVGWGYNDRGQVTVPVGLTNVMAIATGTYHSLALRSDGSVVAWGDNSYGQTRVPSWPPSRVTTLVCGSIFSTVLLPDLRYLSVTSTYGSPVPGVGMNLLTTVTQQLFSVVSPITIGTAQYTCIGWAGSGDVPSTGTSNQVSMILTNDSAISWLWSTNYLLTTTATGPGTVLPGIATNWCAEGSNVALTAVQEGNSIFLGWKGDTNGCIQVSNTLSVPMTRPREIEAQFAATDGSNLAVTPDILSFSGTVYQTIAPQTILITNGISGYANYQVTSSILGISADVASGMLAPGAVTTCVVRVATRGLAPRLYQGKLTISTSATTNSPVNVSVSLHIVPVAPPSRVVQWGDCGSGGVPSWLTNAIAMAGGLQYSLTLCADGSVVAWGDNVYGQCDVPPSLSDAVAVAAGYYHCLALRANGTIVPWGRNDSGQTNVPTGLTSVTTIAAGALHSLASCADGTVVAWGDNEYGQTNVPAGLTDVVVVAAGGHHSLALRVDGRVVAWGRNDFGQTNVPVGLSNVVAVTAGYEHSMALRADGTVVAWGRNIFGLVSVPTGLTNVVAVAAGGYHSLALCVNGSNVIWGLNNYDQTNVPAWLLARTTGIAGGRNHCLALVPVGEATRWLDVSSKYGKSLPGIVGSNLLNSSTPYTFSVDSPVTVGTTQYVCMGWTGSGSVPSAGTSNQVSFVITNDSTLAWLWRTNYMLTTSISGSGTILPMNAAGWYPAGSNVTLTAQATDSVFMNWTGETNGCIVSNRTLTAFMTQARQIQAQFDSTSILVVTPPSLVFTGTGSFPYTPQSFSIGYGGTGAVAYTVTCNVPWLSVDRANGTVMRGNGTTCLVRVSGVAPRGYPGSLTISSPAATNGPQTVLVVLRPASGKVVGWGRNDYGQTSVPAGLTNAVAVTGGGYHSLALRADGTIIAWGWNGVGQCDVPTRLTNATTIGAAFYHSLASCADGTVVAWGASNYCNVPSGLTNVVAVAAGKQFSLALQANGMVTAWGDNTYGQTNVPADLTNAVAVAGGGYHALALRANGTVVAWGNNWYGQTDVPAGLTNVVAVAADDYHSIALRSDGTVAMWGENQVPNNLKNVVAVEARGYHSLSLQSNGTMVTWGGNSYGESNIPTGLSNATAVAAGEFYSLGIFPSIVSLTVNSTYGLPIPGSGNHWLTQGTLQACSVSSPVTIGATQYVCNGWAGAGASPSFGTGTNVSISMCNDVALTWLWSTNVWLSCLAGANGSITNAVSGWYDWNTNLVATAVPKPYYHLYTWQGDILGDASNAMMALTMDRTRSVMASFAENLATNYNTPQWWLAQYNLTNNFDAQELLDKDNDGMPNWAEYVAGTDPLLSDSLLRITQVGTWTTTNAKAYLPITFQSVSNKVYAIQVASAVTGEWLTVSAPFVAVSNRTQVLVRLLDSMPQAFYRVQIGALSTPLTYTLGYGMPDQWIERFDWNTLPPERRSMRNAGDDPDGDGLDNQSEMAAGTDPTDASSCLRMLSFRVQTDAVRLGGSIQTTTGRVYYVESRRPDETEWRPVTRLMSGGATGTMWETSIPTGTRAGFFRAVLAVPSEMTLVKP